MDRLITHLTNNDLVLLIAASTLLAYLAVGALPVKALH